MRKRSKPVYVTHEPLTAHQVLEKAVEIIEQHFVRDSVINSPELAKQYVQCKLALHKREVFGVLLLDSSHRLLGFHELFWGTIDQTEVHAREVIRLVLDANAGGVILAHNHPSGKTEPSGSDRRITFAIRDALALIDVSVYDHIIAGEEPYSFAENQLL